MADARFSAEQRRIVAQRAGECCEYCRTPAAYSADSFCIEHIAPRARGGATELENAAYASYRCFILGPIVGRITSPGMRTAQSFSALHQPAARRFNTCSLIAPDW
jgi:hypothetical protein